MIYFAKVLTTKLVRCFAIIVLQVLPPLDILRIATRYGMGVFSCVVGSTHPKLNLQFYFRTKTESTHAKVCILKL